MLLLRRDNECGTEWYMGLGNGETPEEESQKLSTLPQHGSPSARLCYDIASTLFLLSLHVASCPQYICSLMHPALVCPAIATGLWICTPTQMKIVNCPHLMTQYAS